MITRKPSNEFEAKLKTAIGNDGYYLAAGSASGAIIENKLLARLSPASTDVDGVYEDNVSGKDDNNRRKSARLSLLATPSDQLDFTLTAEINRIESDAQLSAPLPGIRGLTAVGPQVDAAAPGTVASVAADNAADRYSNAFTDPGYMERDSDLLTLKAQWFGENLDLTSITSRSSEDYEESRNFDAAVLDTWGNYVDQPSTQYSQELRFSSTNGGIFTFNDKLEWVSGIYYFEDDAERFDEFSFGPDSVLAPALAPLASGDLLNFPGITHNSSKGTDELDTTSIAIYGQATYALTPELGLTIGIRHTKDEKDFTYTGATNTPGYIPGISDFAVGDTLEFSSTYPRITLDYQVTDYIMVYGTYATGFKSDGVQYAISTTEAALSSFDEEHLTTLEFGVKSRLWNDRLQFNAALYRYDYEDQQVQSILVINNAPTALTQNADESTIHGLEIETTALVSENVTTNFSYTYQDAEFDEFESVDGDRAGNVMAFAPEHAVSLGLNYTINFESAGSLTLQGNYSWKDDYFFDFDNFQAAHQEAYSVVNLAA